jgi:hypothetical protein
MVTVSRVLLITFLLVCAMTERAQPQQMRMLEFVPISVAHLDGEDFTFSEDLVLQISRDDLQRAGGIRSFRMRAVRRDLVQTGAADGCVTVSQQFVIESETNGLVEFEGPFSRRWLRADNSSRKFQPQTYLLVFERSAASGGPVPTTPIAIRRGDLQLLEAELFVFDVIAGGDERVVRFKPDTPAPGCFRLQRSADLMR